MSAVVLLALALGAACGDGSEGADVGTVSASSGCVDGVLEPSIERIEFMHDGRMRSYDLHLPPSYDGTTPFPLVFNFHGFTSSASGQRALSGMDATADANGFIVAYPEGIDSSWNGGACCGGAAAANVDDVGFTRAMLDDLSRRGCIDQRRVYATGMSNGGFMAHRLGCEASDIIAAIAPVAAVIGIDPGTCSPTRSVPVILFNGTQDPLVPFDGSTDFPSVQDTVDGWSSRNGCREEPTTTFDQGDSTCETDDACDADASVALCTINGGGHCWPGRSCGSVGSLDLGRSTLDLNANDAMWELFSSVMLPTP